MKKYLLVLCFLLLVASVIAFFTLKTEGKLRTLPPDSISYKFSSTIKEEIKSGKPGANQFAAWEYASIGEYQAALLAWDDVAGPPRRLSASDSLAFVALQPVDALSYILARARTERIIIINEAHHNPLHRAFTASLLPGLAKLGFRYLAVEGLSERDSLLNERGYPITETGYYTKEPQFGRLLRTAAQSGYTMVLYDYGADHSGPMDAQIKSRETAQARNIQRILQADPEAKIVVHCGFSHVNEGPDGMVGQPAMAARLRALTGINPFTIDQTALTEAGTIGGEEAVYRLAKATNSSVFLNAQDEKPFAQANHTMSVDVNVYHPRTKYRAGRPKWVFNVAYKPVPIVEPIRVGYPCLILAYATSENLAQAIPVDIVELQGPQDNKSLSLNKGDFTLVAKGKGENSQTWTIKN
ncbi:erythromycin esterase family protein [Hymenobacter sp. HDW8]|uniref:erythromycin esterase family protein n=1 Tax=Hymenobacter sp. HDW8 TaxID=2714932 RepID=UPI00140CEADA|nr:erythromycin esterase family protein [Hymenobacter sp. HDW8]QIL76773.1 erythromycin esterase family protein [Hymenobacter sp. HDW8]